MEERNEEIIEEPSKEKITKILESVGITVDAKAVDALIE